MATINLNASRMENMVAQFEMTHIELMSYFLGIEVKQTDKGIFISQKKYAEDILKKFKMEAYNPILIPVEERLKLVKYGSGDLVNVINFRRLVGSLRNCVRPLSTLAIAALSRHTKLGSCFSRSSSSDSTEVTIASHTNISNTVYRQRRHHSGPMFTAQAKTDGFVGFPEAATAHFLMKLNTARTAEGLGTSWLLAFAFKADIAVASKTNLVRTPVPSLATQCGFSKYCSVLGTASTGGNSPDLAVKCSWCSVASLSPSRAMTAQHWRKAAMLTASSILWRK
ncbi:hypothetical protein RJ639_029371 [Escallonia herrerae]|uniref:Reverse transcriptase Ty1/copia-type domain-containing protein n=1 Tax=Escallonia herrerae TaxID=1293975 RepID=A0AA88X5J9_9ASTE|nr:hypothetical protein RJ639_029371 [Escallonia herrerae]